MYKKVFSFLSVSEESPDRFFSSFNFDFELPVWVCLLMGTSVIFGLSFIGRYRSQVEC